MTVATPRVPHATAVSGRPDQLDRSYYANRVRGKAQRIGAPVQELALTEPYLRTGQDHDFRTMGGGFPPSILLGANGRSGRNTDGRKLGARSTSEEIQGGLTMATVSVRY